MKLKIHIHHLTISDFLFFFITPVVTWHLIVFTAHCASLTVVYWSKWLDPQSVFLHGGINGHLMLFMSYVLPIYELEQGRPIFRSTVFPSGPRSEDSTTGGLDFNASSNKFELN